MEQYLKSACETRQVAFKLATPAATKTPSRKLFAAPTACATTQGVHSVGEASGVRQSTASPNESQLSGKQPVLGGFPACKEAQDEPAVAAGSSPANLVFQK